VSPERLRPVWQTARRAARFVSGAAEDLEGADRIAILASWGADPVASRSLSALVDAISATGFRVMVVRASDDPRPLEWHVRPERAPIVIQRSNEGYDFGSWSAGLALAPAAERADRVLFVNDSMVGPFAPLDDIIAGFDECDADAWGLTSTNQYMPHLQSYLFGLRRETLTSPAVRWFWRNVRHERDKFDFVRKYELGLSRLLYSEAFAFRAAFPIELLGPRGGNPTIAEWRRLLDFGVPMVKRELVRNPHVTADARFVPDEIRRRFGQDVAEWI
jgi:hypothetical protein